MEIAKLQREKDQAEARVRELQDKLINNADLSPDKIKDYENQLAAALKEVRDKAWQIQQTQIGAKAEIPGTKQNATSSPSSFDWKWAVGISLGAIIAILLLILVVVNISRKREK
ncbi:MAG: hypothetical protein MRECE_11c025 [Mycoplasmataceae bacterium CE_OT135]|nr:MAG: hypothetical protein MRECE_11c025 [Mycoplasmataceae bacterium CE_OT135]